MRLITLTWGEYSAQPGWKGRQSLLYDFKVGDKVRWVSHARGRWTEKIGEVVEVVPPNRGVLLSKYRGSYALGSFSSKSNPRLHKSYVVAVPVEEGRPKLYWPRANQLEPLSKDET
jgi:hypothetical protein